jgi:hypothetical protein
MSPQQNSPCCLLPPLGLINRLALVFGLMSRLELLLGLMSRLELLLGLMSRLELLLCLMSRLELLLTYCGNSSSCRCRCCWLLKA